MNIAARAGQLRPSVVAIMPEEGRFQEVEQRLDPSFVTTMVAGLTEAEIELGVPRFSVRQEVSLKPILTALGMSDAFTSAANFSGITGGSGLAVLGARQQATIDVTESGTVATAATYINMGTASLPSFIWLSRPFLFLIREASTGTVLFMGRVEDPSAGG